MTTGEEGNFVLPSLPPGEYALTVEAVGFKKEVRSGIILQVGQQARADVTLSPGAVAEVIEVTADVPLVQSENGALGNVVDQKKIVELPLNGRDYLQLAQLQPNVFAPGPIRRDRTFFFTSYEGQRRGQQEASLARVPTVAMKNGDFSALLPGTVLKNPFNNNQPFPNNQIDRSWWSSQGKGLLDLYPDPNLTGANNFVSAAASPLRLDQFSGRIDHKLSGKDSILGAYEFADSNEFFALANPLCSARNVPGWGCNELQRTQHTAVVWTHLFGPRLVNEARIGYTRFGFFRLQQDRDVDVIKRLGIGGLTEAGDPKHPFNNGAPQLSVSGIDTIGGPTNLPQGRHDNTYHYVENMTFIRGSHAMKWGLDIRRFLFNSFFTSFGRGSFTFNGQFSGNAVADLLLGIPRQADRNLGVPFHNAMTFSSGYYFQDDWKVTPRLTLNLGLRYELNLPPVENVDKMASFDPNGVSGIDPTAGSPILGTIKVAGGQEAYISDPVTKKLLLRPRSDVGRRLWNTDTNNFAPRVGLAWRPFTGNETVIRAGFGTFYNYQIVGNGITPLSRNSPFRQRQTAGPITVGQPFRFTLADAFSTSNPSVVAPGIDPNFVTAYINEWSFGVQREIAKDVVVDVSYLGSEGHKLPIGVNINQAFPGPGSIGSRRPFPAFGNITGGFISSVGNSNYHALQARVERRMTKGLSFISSYTWSKAMDYNPGISTSSDSSGVFAQNARNLRAERALSDYDVSHRWVVSYVYDLPFGSGRRFSPPNRVASAIMSGWQLTGILTLQSGRPFTVGTSSSVDNSNTGGGNDRPNLIGDPHIPNPGPDRWFNTCTRLANGTLVNCLAGDSPAWGIPAAGTFGNAGRNILRGAGLKNFDFGLYRTFRITERQGFQFRAEIFNLTNHPNFFFPNATVLSSATTGNRAFGTISRAAFQSQTGAQRQIQFALKYVF